MKKIVLGFYFATIATPTLAIEVVMDGYKPWLLIASNNQGADTIDIDQTQSQGEFRRVFGAHYYPETIQFNEIKDGRTIEARADFVLTTSDFDCRRAGTYRLRDEQYYTVSNADPSWTYRNSHIANGTAKWSIATSNEPQYATWQLLCKSINPPGMIGLDKFVGKRQNIYHSEVLRLIRNQIQHQN